MMARPDSGGKHARVGKRVTISEELNADESLDDDFIIDDDSSDEEGEDISEQIERLYKSYQETGPAPSGNNSARQRPQSAQRYLGRPSSAVQEARARPPSAPTPSRGGIDGERVEFRPSRYYDETDNDIFGYENASEAKPASPLVGGALVDIREEDATNEVPEGSDSQDEEVKYSDDFADEDEDDSEGDSADINKSSKNDVAVEVQSLSDESTPPASQEKVDESAPKPAEAVAVSVTDAPVSKATAGENSADPPTESGNTPAPEAPVVEEEKESEPVEKECVVVKAPQTKQATGGKAEVKQKGEQEKMAARCKKLESDKLRLQSMLEDLRCELTRVEKEKAAADDKNRKLSADLFNLRADSKATEKKLREAAIHWKRKYEEEHRTRALMETVAGQKAVAQQVRPKSGRRRPASAGRPLSASVLNSENTIRGLKKSGERPQSAARRYQEYTGDGYNRVEAISFVEPAKKSTLMAPTISTSGRGRRAVSANSGETKLSARGNSAGKHSNGMVHGKPTPYGTLYTSKQQKDSAATTGVSESQRLQMAHIQADLESLRAALRDGSHHTTPLGAVRASIMRNR